MKNVLNLRMTLSVLASAELAEKIFTRLHHVVVGGSNAEGFKDGPDHGDSTFDRYYQFPTEEEARIMATIFGCGTEFDCQILDSSEIEIGANLVAQGKVEIPPEEKLQEWTLFWRDGKSETIEGNTIADAMNHAGYGAGALGALDFYEKGDKALLWEWKKETRSWDKKATHTEFADYHLIPVQKEGVFRFDSMDIPAMVVGGCGDKLISPLTKKDITKSYNKLIRKANPVDEVYRASIIGEEDWALEQFKGESVKDNIITQIGRYTMNIKGHECKLWVVKRMG